MKTTILRSLATTLLVCSSWCNAGIVYDNGGPNIDSNRCISGPNVCGGSGTWTEYGNFTLSNATTITGFTNWITQRPQSSYQSTNWSIWTVTPSLSGSAFASGNSIGNAFTNQGFTEVDVNGLFVSLLPGSYWLGINEVASTTFSYVTSNLAKPSTTIELDGSSYTFTGLAPMAFNITGTVAEVPEPTTLSLLGLGLLGFAASRRKSAK